jgi:hypothetical protein
MLLAAAVLTTLAGNVHAQVLSSSTLLTSEFQTLIQGEQVYGGNDAYNNLTLNNGVTFGTRYVNGNVYTPSTIPGSTVSVRTDGAYRGDYTAEGFFTDGNLNNALQYDSTGSYGQYYIEGLTPGVKYELQLFATMTSNGYTDGGASGSETVQDITAGGNGATTTLNWGQATPGVGSGTYFITELFTANSSGQEQLFFSSISGAPVQIGASQILNLSVIPEPSTYAMMLAGLAVLGFCVRRKGALVK